MTPDWPLSGPETPAIVKNGVESIPARSGGTDGDTAATDPEQEAPMTPIERVYSAIGQASMCWHGGTGGAVFDDAQATRVADSLIADLREMGALNTEPAQGAPVAEELWIIFDGPPGPDGLRLVDAERPNGQSVDVGAWRRLDAVTPGDSSERWALTLHVDPNDIRS